MLKDRLLRTEELQTRAIYMTFSGSGWAQFFINEHTGSLVIESDWGHYHHRWGGGPSAWGKPTFTAFLASCNKHYLVDKLSYDAHPKTELDATETLRTIRRLVCEARRSREYGTHTSRKLWREAEQLVDAIDDLGLEFVAREWRDREICVFIERHGPLYEYMSYQPTTRLRFLRDELLPLFLEYLRDAPPTHHRDD